MAEAEQAEGEAASGGDVKMAAPRIESALPEGAARCVPEVAIVAPRPDAIAKPRRPPPRPWVTQLALAGVIGGGIAALVFGIVWMIDAARIARPLSNGSSVPLILALDAVVGLVAALRFGFGSRARSTRDLVLRGIGALVFGAMAWGAILGAVLALNEVGSREELHSAVWFFALGLVLALAGLFLERRRPKHLVTEPRTMLTEDPRNAPLAWSGMFGGSLAAWAVASLAVYNKDVSPIHDAPLVVLMLVSTVFAIALATSRGYASDVRPHIRLGRRFGGALGFGFLAGISLFLLLGIFVSVGSSHQSTERAAIVLVPAFAALLALAGVHLLAPRRRGSLREAAITAAAMLFATLYTQSTWVRYAVGSETAAFVLANDHYEDGDYDISVRYFEIACDRGNDLACVRASAQYDAGLGVRVDATRAEAFLRLACDEPEACLDLAGLTGDARTKERASKRACDLAGGKYCDRYRAAVLSDACDQRDVFACRDLARMSGGMAPFYYQKACGFGDVEACAMAR